MNILMTQPSKPIAMVDKECSPVKIERIVITESNSNESSPRLSTFLFSLYSKSRSDYEIVQSSSITNGMSLIDGEVTIDSISSDLRQLSLSIKPKKSEIVRFGLSVAYTITSAELAGLQGNNIVSLFGATLSPFVRLIYCKDSGTDKFFICENEVVNLIGDFENVFTEVTPEYLVSKREVLTLSGSSLLNNKFCTIAYSCNLEKCIQDKLEKLATNSIRFANNSACGTCEFSDEVTSFMLLKLFNAPDGMFNKLSREEYSDEEWEKYNALFNILNVKNCDCCCDCDCSGGEVELCDFEQEPAQLQKEYILKACEESNLLSLKRVEENGVVTYTLCINEDEIVDNDWFRELNTNCLGAGFPTEGTETQKRQFLIDKICEALLPPPSMTNIGDGVGVYKSFNNNAYELKSLKKSVIQPTNPDMLSGNIAVNLKENTNDIEFEFDFSTLKVASIPAEGSIKTYYVFQTTSNAYVGDGSVSRPYKNWTDCKNAIIGTGDFTAPQNNNSRVVFLNNITSNESLTVNTLIYEFRNSSIFNYKPVASETLDDAVIDFQKIINTSPSVSINIKLTGTGTITREDISNTSKQVIIRHKGGLDGIYRILDFTENCNITLREKKQPINIFTACINPDTALPLTASNGYPIYVVNNDLPMPEGLFSCIDSNNASSSEVYIRVGSTLNIITNAQVGIYNSGSSIQNYGTIIFSNHRAASGVLMRYDSIDGTITSPYNGRYTPHLGLSMIKLLNNGLFNTLSSGAIYYNLSGNIKQGGFNSFVEIDNGKFVSTSNIGFVFEFFAYFNSIFKLKGSGANNIDIKRINTNLQPRQNIFSADSSAENVANTIKIYYGVIELLKSYAQNDTIFSSSLLKINTTLKTTDLTLSGLLMHDFDSMPTALSVGFSGYVKGTLYRKKDVDNEWVLCIKS